MHVHRLEEAIQAVLYIAAAAISWAIPIEDWLERRAARRPASERGAETAWCATYAKHPARS